MTKFIPNSKQMTALSLLLKGKSQNEVAKEIGVTRQTIGNYMRIPGFAWKLNQMQQKRMRQVVEKIYAQEDRAFQVIDFVLNNPKAKDSDKLRAVDLVLRASFQFTQQQDLMKRIGAIEEWMGNWETLSREKVDWVDLKSNLSSPPHFVVPKIKPEQD